MKYLVTLVRMTKTTRRRAGKSFTEVVDWKPEKTETTLYDVEQTVEGALRHTFPGMVVKVIDVREIE